MALVEGGRTSATTHGLSNETGENNCFINSVIQILWHLDIFRKHFGQIQQHMCYEMECVFCTLKELFVNFEYSESVTLPPNFIRKAMAKCYRESGRFQLSRMDYAVECYEAVLQQIHSQITGNDWDTTCTDPKCLPHKIFSYSSCQIDVCGCGATSEPFPSEDILFYISADNLLKSMKKSKKDHKEILKDGSVFGKILRDSLSTDKTHKCPDNSACKKPARIESMLLRSPYTINLSLSWSSESSSKERVVEVLKSVGHIINISQMFTISLDESAQHKLYHLSGIISYYGHHFSAFVYNTNLRRWVFCDDASFRTVSEDWNEVVQLVKRARYQPELLIYSTRDVDISLEESSRLPPKIPPKPKIADLLSGTIPSIATDPQADPRRGKPGEDSKVPILPPTLNTSFPIQPTAPPIPDSPSFYPNSRHFPKHSLPPHSVQQQSPIPSAPPAHLANSNVYQQSHQSMAYSKAPAQSVKRKLSNAERKLSNAERKLSNAVPSSQDPVILTSYSLKPERRIYYPPTKIHNTPVSTPDLLTDFEIVSRPDTSDTESAPNLLLDVTSQTPSQSNSRLLSRPERKREETHNLIDLTVIPVLKADDVYKEFFPDPPRGARGSSKPGQSSTSS